MKKTDGKAMVAQHPKGELRLVEEIATERGVSGPVLAGLRRSTGWAPGKQVTDAQFDEAQTLFNSRSMGSGRL